MINLNEERDLLGVLKSASDKNERVTVLLEGGKEYTGKPKSMTDTEFYSLRELSGKEFYDVIFRIDKVIAIEVKAK